jgi:hypothetical protein
MNRTSKELSLDGDITAKIAKEYAEDAKNAVALLRRGKVYHEDITTQSSR